MMLKTFIFLLFFIGLIYYIYHQVLNYLEQFRNMYWKKNRRRYKNSENSCNTKKIERKINNVENDLAKVYKMVEKIDNDLNEDD
jgi:nitrate/nitrite-specific signal transduction histidine kinase